MTEIIQKDWLKKEFLILFYLVLYGGISLLFLTRFPFVHSDESWLAGLSRNMGDMGSLSVTEPFFNLKPRYPHAIKILFHSLQLGSIRLFGYWVGSVRLLSLLAGLFSLYLFYHIALILLKSNSAAWILTIIFSMDIQFIYASHFARQEIWILFILLCCFFVLICSPSPYTVKKALLLGCLTGISIGFHPNSFLIACSIGGFYTILFLRSKVKSLKPFLLYIAVTGGFAGLFTFISFHFDSHFLSHYFSYGSSEFGIDASTGQRMEQLAGFFSRLFERQSGTYYVADIRFQFILFAIAASFTLFFCLVMKKEEPKLTEQILSLLAAGIFMVFGIFIIGRFSQLSILFLFPIGWLLTALFLKLFDAKIQVLLYGILLLSISLLSMKEINPYLTGETYDDYIKQASAFASPDSRVLGNLNLNFYFDNGSLLDYRNLPYAMEEDGGIASYIDNEKIQYIYYSQELDFLYENRPYYNVIYGNSMFIPALKEYCQQECTKAGEFKNNRYGARVLNLIGREAYSGVTVYKTKWAPADIP